MRLKNWLIAFGMCDTLSKQERLVLADISLHASEDGTVALNEKLKRQIATTIEQNDAETQRTLDVLQEKGWLANLYWEKDSRAYYTKLAVPET